MKITIIIDTSGHAFTEKEPGIEAAQIIRDVANHIEMYPPVWVAHHSLTDSEETLCGLLIVEEG